MAFKDIVLGFTGTRLGMTDLQREGVEKYIFEMKPRIAVAHHGDCVGSDKEFHEMCLQFLIPVEIHPPTKNQYRAFCRGGVKYHEPKDYGVRDKDIVNACNVLLATPASNAEILRSGTWMTIRMARKAKHNPLVSIFNPFSVQSGPTPRRNLP